MNYLKANIAVIQSVQFRRKNRSKDIEGL